MTCYKWGISFQGSFDWVLAVHSAVLLTIRVHHTGEIDIESLEAHLYFLCMRFWRETDRNSNPTIRKKEKTLQKWFQANSSAWNHSFLASYVSVSLCLLFMHYLLFDGFDSRFFFLVNEERKKKSNQC